MAFFPNTSGPDVLTGTALDDQFFPNAGLGGGNDVFRGLDGNDFMDGGTGNDTLYGGAGNDQLVGGAGTNALYGGLDADTLQVTAGNGGVVDGGLGQDRVVFLGFATGGVFDLSTGIVGSFTLSSIELLTATFFDDTVRGGNADEQLDGMAGDDLIYGGIGRDTLIGGNGNDAIYGGDGGDTILGDVGQDSLFGGKGEDFMVTDVAGQLADDRAFGLGGNDLIQTRGGNDVLNGGDGVDTLVIATTARVVANLAEPTLVINLGATGNLVVAGFENLSTDAGNDEILGSSDNNLLSGNGGDDDILGRIGNDTLRGGFGSDTLFGGAGDDVIVGDGDGDTLFGGGGEDLFEFANVASSPVGDSDTLFDLEFELFLPIDKIVMNNFTDFSGDVTLAPRICRFTFIGTSAFSGTADEIRFSNGLLQADSNQDGVSDFEVVVMNRTTLSDDSFIL